MATYGMRFAEHVEAYLAANNLRTADGKLSLGKLNRTVLIELADRFEQSERRRDKKERTAKLSRAERDKLFDALAEGTGSVPRAMTAPDAKICATAISQIIAVTPDVTTTEIEIACRKFRQMHPTVSFTPHAIAKNWSRLIDKDRVGPDRRKPIDVSVEPGFDWRKVIKLRYPRSLPAYVDRPCYEEESWGWVPSNIKRVVYAEGQEILARNP